MKQLINYLNINKENKIGLLDYIENDYYIITGKYNGSTFDGSDKLSMSVMNSVDQFIKSNNKIIFYEGDRFTNKTFINKYNPFIIKIMGSGLWGRNKRNSTQSKRQINSIQTRVNNINANIEFENSESCLNNLINIIKKSNGSPLEFQNQLIKLEKTNQKKQTTLF